MGICWRERENERESMTSEFELSQISRNQAKATERAFELVEE